MKFKKILIAVKRVLDYTVRVRVKADESGVDLSSAKMSINPFDEIALEEALRLKEAGHAEEIHALTCGAAVTQDVLRHALALGADKAFLLQTDVLLEPLAVAKLLAAFVKAHGYDAVFLGKQAIDDDCNQTGQMLAALLGWPQATFASKLVVGPDGVAVTREIDGGLETLALQAPLIVTTDLRLNTPRYPTLPNIMQAKRKPLETIAADSFGVDLAPRLKTTRVAPPPMRKGGIKVESVDELVQRLRNEAKAIE